MEEENVQPSDKVICSLTELEPNILYCNSQSVYEAIDQTNVNVPIKVQNHCISFRLLHYFGPFNNTELQCRTALLIANCFHDPTHNALIAIKLDDYLCDDILNYDNINRTFSLQNFKTFLSSNILFEPGSEDCHILSNPLCGTTLFVSSEFKSNLIFSIDNPNMSPQMTPSSNGVSDNNEAMDEHDSISDISDGDLSEVTLPPPPNLMSEDDTNLPEVVDSDLGAQSRMDFEVDNLTARQKASTPRRFFAEDNDSTNRSHLAQDTIIDRENQDPNGEQNSQFQLSSALSFSHVMEEILKKIDDCLKQDYLIEAFIKSNIDSFGDEDINLTKLSQLVYPSNDIQDFCFANVVGIVKSASSKNNRTELIIYDEEIDNFVVQLGYRDIDSVKNDYKHTGLENLFFPDIRLVDYPSLSTGAVICIRDLCLTTSSSNNNNKTVNFCAHPNQIRLIKTTSQYDKMDIDQKRKLSQEEFIRLIELICFSAKQLVLSPAPKTVNNYKMFNFAGQFLAMNRGNQKGAKIYVLLPFENSMPTFLTDFDASFIAERIENMSFSESRKIYKKALIDRLFLERRIIMVTLYENHIESLEGIVSLEYLVFFNVHLKEDRYYAGFSQYILHGGSDFGRKCYHVDSSCILGCTISKSINALIKEITFDPVQAAVLDVEMDDDNNFTGAEDNQPADRSRNEENPSEEIDNHMSNTKEESVFLSPSANLSIAEPIESFNDLIDCESKIFRISARMVDYDFEDKVGSPISNMAAFRRNFINFTCTGSSSKSNCDFTSSFYSMMPKITKIISSGESEQKLFCPKCSSEILPNLSIQLTLQDEPAKQILKVFLATSEFYDLVGCTSQQLVFLDPLSIDICHSLKYVFTSLCPQRQTREEPNVTRSRKKRRDKPETQLCDSNGMFEWIVQCIKTKQSLNITEQPTGMFNSHLFNDSSRHFYLRGILKHST